MESLLYSPMGKKDEYIRRTIRIPALIAAFRSSPIDGPPVSLLIRYAVRESLSKQNQEAIMKTILCAGLLLISSVAWAETERLGIVTWEEPFQPQYFLYNKDLGTVWGLQGGTVVGPTRILPGSGAPGLALPPLPMMPSGPTRHEQDMNFQQTIIDSLDRDIDALIRLTE